MIALLALLFILAVFGVFVAWLGSHPGTVQMVWFGYEIETSAPILLAIIVIIAFILTFTYNLITGMLAAPGQIMQRRNTNQLRSAIHEITTSVAALAASDMDTARRHTKKAEKLLGTTPLTLLLKAQISKNEGNDRETRALLEKLLDHPETEYLAAKSLSDGELRQQHLPQALMLAKRAHHINPKQNAAAWSVFNLLLENGQLPEAELHAKEARKKRSFTRSDLKKAHGKIALHKARKSLENGSKETALSFAKSALKALPEDDEAVLLAATLYVETLKQNKARALIERQWKITPSQQLAELFERTIADEKEARQEKLIAKLKDSNPHAPENKWL